MIDMSARNPDALTTLGWLMKAVTMVEQSDTYARIEWGHDLWVDVATYAKDTDRWIGRVGANFHNGDMEVHQWVGSRSDVAMLVTRGLGQVLNDAFGPREVKP